MRKQKKQEGMNNHTLTHTDKRSKQEKKKEKAGDATMSDSPHKLRGAQSVRSAVNAIFLEQDQMG